MLGCGFNLSFYRVGSVLQPDPFGCDPRDVDEDEEARFKNEKDVDNEDSKAMSTATTAETLNPGTFAATFVAQIHPEALAVNNIVKVVLSVRLSFK